MAGATRGRPGKGAVSGGTAASTIGGAGQGGSAAHNKQFERGLNWLRKGQEFTAKGMKLLGIGTADTGARSGP